MKYPIGTIWYCSDEKKKGRLIFWIRLKKKWKFICYGTEFDRFPPNISYIYKKHKLDI